MLRVAAATRATQIPLSPEDVLKLNGRLTPSSRCLQENVLVIAGVSGIMFAHAAQTDVYPHVRYDFAGRNAGGPGARSLQLLITFFKKLA